MTLIQTIPGEGNAYSKIHERVLTRPGFIVDIGCLAWDWCGMFIGQKRVVGADPFAEPMMGCELFNGLVGPFTGEVQIREDGDASSIMQAHDSLMVPAPMKCWKTFCTDYGIGPIAALKINIEGGEYPLLHSMDEDDFTQIDQIAVSFHDWINPRWKHLTEASIAMLERLGFSVQDLGQWGWHLAIKR